MFPPSVRVALPFAVALCLSLPASAGAWTASSAGSTLTISAAPGETNAFSLNATGGEIQITDTSGTAFVTPAPAGCSQPIPQRLSCPAGLASRVEILAGDRDDTVSNALTTAAVTVHGGPGDDILNGAAGDDQLWGDDGDDALYGNGGNDALDGGDGRDELDGGNGNDVLAGGLGRDELYGGLDDDVLDGGGDADQIEGGNGTDTVEGGAGADAIDGGAGDDSLGGGPDADVIAGGGGADTLLGSTGDDTLEGEDGSDQLDGGDGKDTLSGGSSADALRGGDGNDTVDGGDGGDAVRGETGNDNMTGGAGEDALDGGPGNDVVSGGEGADAVRGDDGRDELSGGAGDDVVQGLAGDDVLSGGVGNDDLQGGDGDDRLDGSSGADTTSGGSGHDIADYGARSAPVGIVVGLAAGSGETAEGDSVATDIEVIIGGVGSDTLDATAAVSATTLAGGEGDDTLTGGPDADRLDGGPGADVLTGRGGADVLDGGDGADTASYADRTEALDISLDDTANDGSAGENDLVRTENVVGGSGGDRISGGAGPNLLDGAGGDDVLVATGDPTSIDDVLCGGGNDAYLADDGDFVSTDCERNLVPAVADPAIAPRVGVAVAAEVLRIRTSGSRHRIPVRVSCDQDVDRYCRIRLSAVIGRGKRGVTLRWSEFTLRPGKARLVYVTVSAKALAQIRRLPAASRKTGTLRVLAYDATETFALQKLPMPVRGTSGRL